MRIVTGMTISLLNVSADEWDLYSQTRPLESAAAADEINRAIIDAVNSGTDRRGGESAAHKVMGQYADLGAMDSESLWRLGEVLDRLYDRSSGLR